MPPDTVGLQEEIFDRPLIGVIVEPGPEGEELLERSC